MPDALKPLTYKLSDFVGATVKGQTQPGLIEYPLTTSASSSGTSVVGGLTFNTSASVGPSAVAAIQVYDKSPDWAVSAGYEKPETELLVRIGLHGQLSAAAKASSTPVWGSVLLDVGADASASLDYCFDYPASRYVAQVLIDSLPQMSAPGDLAGLLRSCSTGTDFAMCITALGGKLTVGGTVQVGYPMDSRSRGRTSSQPKMGNLASSSSTTQGTSAH